MSLELADFVCKYCCLSPFWQGLLLSEKEQCLEMIEKMAYEQGKSMEEVAFSDIFDEN